MNGTAGRLTHTQVTQLLRPIHPGRVLQANGHSHLAQQDVTAHLIRVFGFGGFDTEVLSIDCLFEHARLNDDNKPNGKWDVGYKALMRLTIRDPHGVKVATYENGATATAENQKLGAAHDLAYKSAISLSLKRCTINLGDQFGLSLYNKGQTDALVIGSLVIPPEPTVKPESDTGDDIQSDVPEQLGDGDDGSGTIHLDESQGDPDEPTGLRGVMKARRAATEGGV